MSYEVIKELKIPVEAHHRPIPADVLPAFGIAREASQTDLLLAQVAFNGVREGEDWFVAAFDAVNPPAEGQENDIYGGIVIRGGEVEAEDALDVAETWVRESEDTSWVPGPVLKINVAAEGIAGVLLVRGGNKSVSVPRTVEVGGFTVSGVSDEQANLLKRREAFVKQYLAERGWDANDLTIEQLLEVRAQEGWKNPAEVPTESQPTSQGKGRRRLLGFRRS